MATPSSASWLDVLRVSKRRARGALEYTFTLPDGSKPPSQPHTQSSRDALERDLLDAATRLHHWSADGAADPDAGEATLSRLGDHLTERYLPPEVLEFLFQSQDPLAIETDDPEFPWELLRSGGRILGLHRPLARMIRRRTPPVALPADLGRRALLVGDPTQDASPSMMSEINELARALRANTSPYQVADLLGATASYGAVMDQLQKDGRLFHFAGHVSFDPEHPKLTSLTFPDGLAIDAGTLEGIVGAYAFVFINGCASGRAAQRSLAEQVSRSGGTQRMRGLAIPFLNAGAPALVGTLWPVADESAAAFAKAFYELALNGTPLGEALRQVRLAWRARFPRNPTWGAYILYGDPRLVLDGAAASDAREPRPASDRAPAVHLTSGAVVSGARLRGSQAEEFLLLCQERDDDDSDNSDFHLEPSGAAALERAIAWVTKARWRLLARFDLFLGLAYVPDSLVARGLRAYGVSNREIQRMNVLMFGTGRDEIETPAPSSGVASALRRAARIARFDGRDGLTADDIALGLLDQPSVSGSLRRAFNALGISPRDLLAAGRGEPPRLDSAALTPSSAAHGAQTELQSGVIAAANIGLLGDDLGAERHGDKPDSTPRKLLRDLRDEVKRTLRDGEARRGPGLRPFVGRERELSAVIRILTRPYSHTVTPHVVIRGPSGVGCNALAYALGAKLVTDPNAGEFAPIRDWAIAAARVSRESERIDAWLRAEVQSRHTPTILVIEDLPELLSFPGLPETLIQAARHPNIRIVAVASDRAYAAIRDDNPDLARLFNSVDLEPPRPERAVEMTRAHIARLERRFSVNIEPDAAAEAVTQGPRYTRQALPGAAINLLAQACAAASHQAIALDLERDWPNWEVASERASAPGQEQRQAGAPVANDTLPLAGAPIVTAQFIRSMPAPGSRGSTHPEL